MIWNCLGLCSSRRHFLSRRKLEFHGPIWLRAEYQVKVCTWLWLLTTAYQPSKGGKEHEEWSPSFDHDHRHHHHLDHCLRQNTYFPSVEVTTTRADKLPIYHPTKQTGLGQLVFTFLSEFPFLIFIPFHRLRYSCLPVTWRFLFQHTLSLPRKVFFWVLG